MDLYARFRRWCWRAVALAVALALYAAIVGVFVPDPTRGALLMVLVPGWFVGGFLVIHPWLAILNDLKIPFREQPNMGWVGLLWPLAAVLMLIQTRNLDP